MKTKWKKLLAVMLAGVMALSCTVFASASEPNPLNGVGAVDPEDTGEEVILTGDDTTQNVETKYAGGSAQGRSRSEGPLPADPIRLELPTVGIHTLDMILDPHGLINRTGMARYGGENVTFEEDTTLYFLKSIDTPEGATDPVYTYGDETQALTITNKSNLPVGVDVTLRVDKGLDANDESFDIIFVDDPDELADAQDATMYLALKKGDKAYPVENYDADETIYYPPTVDVPDAGDTDNPLADAIAATAPEEVDDSNYDKATFQWAKAVPEDAEEDAVPEDVGDSLKEAFIEEIDESSIITVTYTEEGAVAAVMDGDTVATPAVAGTPTFTIEPADIGDCAAEVIIGGFVENTITNTTRDVNVMVRYYLEATEATETTSATPETDVAYVYFVIAAESLQDRTVGNTVTLTIEKFDDTDAPNSEDMGRAEFIDSLSKPEGAYVEGWDEDAGYFWAFLDDYQTTEGKAKLVEWKHTVDATAADGTVTKTPKSFDGTYPSLSFSIVGAINGTQNRVSPWDNHGDKIKLDLIWDVFAVEGEFDTPEDDEPEPTVSGKKATITSVSPATGTTTTKGKATVNFTAGDGDYDGYVPTALVADETVVAVVSYTETSAVVQTKDVRDATSFALRFELDGDSYDVPITDALW